MTGHLDLRHDDDITVTRIRNKLPQLLLRIKASVGGALSRPCLRTHSPRHVGMIHAPGTRAGEFRILPDLDAPTLIIGEVPMETIHLIPGHQVDVLTDDLGPEEMTAHIEMKPAPSEPGPVLHRHADHLQGCIGADGWKRLQQRLHPVKDTGLRTRNDADCRRGHRHAVAFFPSVEWSIQPEFDGSARWSVDGQGETGNFPYGSGEYNGDRPKRGIRCIVRHGCGFIYGEISRGDRHALWHGNDRRQWLRCDTDPQKKMNNEQNRK